MTGVDNECGELSKGRLVHGYVIQDGYFPKKSRSDSTAVLRASSWPVRYRSLAYEEPKNAIPNSNNQVQVLLSDRSRITLSDRAPLK